jgi:hypothetical protein
MEPTQFDFIFGFYYFYLSAIVFALWRFFLQEFRIAGVRSTIRTFQIVANKLK